MEIGLSLLSIVGSVFTFGGLVEHYRRHRDRQAVATVIAAEITTLMVFGKTAADLIKVFLPIYRTRPDLKFEDAYSVEPTHLPVFDKNLERIGLLRKEHAEDIVRFYYLLMGTRVAVRNWLSGASLRRQTHMPLRLHKLN